MAKILKGADVVEALNSKMISQVKELRNKGIIPTIATVRVGEVSDQISYEKAVIKRAETVGVANLQVVLPLDVDEETVINEINTLNNDSNVHGVLIFRPLPKHLNDERIRLALNPEKDIDGITDGSLAGVFSDSDTGFAPCTAKACIEILDFYNINCTGKRAVVIGRSLVVGKPVAIMLMGKNATVTV
ncbi:MAG: bifunctional 5,10-methylene-tetrahydrofolate dehydrogenase/5,10-methylene-tetrahydrofolate cyclohydrolase, partial [Oscillospiraceae bacterium]|nr:bifunctional 5,10-methylene-tetrahydrofolate dehydrogenase/5,10-methylene-tetrahydrofolate cyclohydrolase [Oscillospiraceae bacterium]